MLGSILGAVGSVASSLLGKSSADKQAEKQARLQKEFAQSGIQWKVEDAKKAGIHPLYALGANTISYQPQSIGGSGLDLGAMGQNIGSAIDNTRSVGAKADALSTSLLATQIEGAKIDNEIKKTELASKIATTHPTGIRPGLPSEATTGMLDNQGNAITVDGPTIKNQTRVDVAARSAPHSLPVTAPDVTTSRTALGGYAPSIPPEQAEALESDRIGYYLWMMRNRVLPNFVDMPPPFIQDRKPHEAVYFHVPTQEWRRHYYGPSFRRSR